MCSRIGTRHFCGNDQPCNLTYDCHMRFQSLRQTPSNRHKLAALLAILAPGAAMADGVENGLRGGQSPSPSLRSSVGVRPVDHTDLVPLPDELANPGQAGIRPVTPAFRIAKNPQHAPLVLDVAEDGWMPRTMRDAVAGVPLIAGPINPTQANPLGSPVGAPTVASPPRANAIMIGGSASSRLQIIPNMSGTTTDETTPPSVAGLNGPSEGKVAEKPLVKKTDQAAAERITSAEQVSNPEQNEPTENVSAADNAMAELTTRAQVQAEDEGVVPPESGEDDAYADGQPLESDSDAEMREVDGESAAEATSKTGTSASSVKSEKNIGASASPEQAIEIRKLRLEAISSDRHEEPDARIATNRMRVGDVSPHSSEEVKKAQSPAIEILPVEPKREAQANNPIQGDRITAEGELILATGKSAANLPVKPQTARIKPFIEQVLRYHWDRPEDAAERTHWGMMHSIMVFDRDTQIVNRRQRFNAVAWMAGNNPCRNQPLFSIDANGILPRTGVGLQGHQAQLLAIFGLINVPLNYPVYASRQKFSVADILQREMLDCKVNTELTFTLIALSHYTDSDTSWVAADGQNWSVERVLREELAQPIVGAACGGTHRLMGFAHALRRRRAEGKPIDGQWERADRYIKDFIAYTWSLQNRDGSMSTAWYERSEDNGDMDRKIQTTGHMLEMLLTITPDAELQSPEMLRTVSFMANTMYAERGHEWQVGPKGHALRSLAMYYQRVFGDSTPWRSSNGTRSAGASSSPSRNVR